jgi:pimeloyl-ACP methyl ester carboxylesterase
MADTIKTKPGFSDVNGIKIYHEIYGKGEPLVLIHGGGSTIASSFGMIIPLLAGKYQLIAVELQNHGRSGQRNIPQTFEQDADDVAELLKTLKVTKASFFGFSNGGTTAMQVAIRHPEIVDKLILAAPAFSRDGFINGFFDGMKMATIDNMPGELKKAFLDVNPDSSKLQHMFEKDRDRMIAFSGIPDEKIQSIKSPALVINGDKDVITTEHVTKLSRMIPNSELAIIPGVHGKYIGEVTTLPVDEIQLNLVVLMIDQFLKRQP